MKKLFMILLFLLSGFCLTGNLHAQVTIGSNASPGLGALLDLKQDGATTKGLGLPRVVITKLKPATPAELSASIGAKGNWILADHAGLVVYNTKATSCSTDIIYEGLYVFDGKEWQSVQKGAASTSSDVSFYSDTRSQSLGTQSYAYREIYYIDGSTKESAGIWMLENMRYIPDGTDPNFTGFIEDAGEDSGSKCWCYPWKGAGSNLAYNSAEAKANWDSRAGILYSWGGANNGREVENVDEGENESNDGPLTDVQGICPSGWHVPSDKEWNRLERVMYNAPTAFSRYTASDLPFQAVYNSTGTVQGWQVEWNGSGQYYLYDKNEPPTTLGGYGYRGVTAGDKGHALAMLSECILPSDQNAVTGGKSLPASQGGFDIYLAGYAKEGSVSSYGSSARFWTASSYSTGHAWSRKLESSNPQIGRQSEGEYQSFYYSLRCKKDDN